MEIAIGVILFLVGAIVGMVIQALRTESTIIGTLLMLRPDPNEGPYLCVELDKPLESTKWKKFAILRVSQK